MRISDWSSDVCSSDLGLGEGEQAQAVAGRQRQVDRRCSGGIVRVRDEADAVLQLELQDPDAVRELEAAPFPGVLGRAHDLGGAAEEGLVGRRRDPHRDALDAGLQFRCGDRRDDCRAPGVTRYMTTTLLQLLPPIPTNYAT